MNLFKSVKSRLEDARNRFDNISQDVKSVYFGTVAMRRHVERTSALVVPRFQTAYPTGNPFLERESLLSAHTVIGIQAAREFNELPALESMLRIAEASDEFKTAKATIEPVLSEIEELESGDQKERAEFHRIAAELHEKQEAAKEAARQAFNDSPEVVQARKRLEAIAAARGE